MAEKPSLADLLERLRDEVQKAESRHRQLLALGGVSDSTDLFRSLGKRLVRVQRYISDFLPREQQQVKDLGGAVQQALAPLVAYGVESRSMYNYDHYINRLDEASRKFFETTTPLVFDVVLRRLDDEDIEKKKEKIDELVRLVEEASQGQLSSLSQLMEDLKADAKASVEKEVAELRNVAASSGVEESAKHFQAEATLLERQSTRWLRLLAGSLLVVLGITLYTLLWLTKEAHWTGAQAARTGGAILLVFTAASYLTYFASRNYRATMHNLTVTRHRVNALNTFQAFAYASKGDPQARAAVLLQATQTIFGHQSSGYTEQPGMEAPSAAVEIVNRIVQAKDGH